MSQNAIFKWRRGTAARWAEVNPVLSDGEPGAELDTGKFKLGDGFTPWNDLDYFIPTDIENPGNAEEVAAALAAHISSLTPHDVYDNGPSLVLRYENAKAG
jgi:hypothetical protein